jgi:glycosyltransferase involved in cell wall biosynthesis
MRLLHLSNDLYPAVTGGTELFVQQLLQAQQQLLPGMSILSAAHRAPSVDADHNASAPLAAHQRLLPPVLSGSRRQRLGAEAAAIPGFVELLAEFRPTHLHLHSFSERCGLSHVRLARAAGVRVLVTVHAPGFSCIKGHLIDASGAVCDGRLRLLRCTRCRLHHGGLPRALAAAVALQSGWPLSAEAPGRLAHVLTARQLTAAFQAAWLELTRQAYAIHVLAAWSRDLLLRQGVPAHKLHLIRSAGPAPLPPRQRRFREDGLLRLVYWGRCEPVKGLHLLVRAIRALPASAPLVLDCYGPYWHGPYGERLQRWIEGDPRFQVCGTLPQAELLPRLQAYDLGVLPSTWLETAPLTLLEAFAAGLPMAGSDLAGIRELLQGVDGCSLLQPHWRAWHQLFSRLLAAPIGSAPPALPRPRSWADLASELQPLLQGTRP